MSIVSGAERLGLAVTLLAASQAVIKPPEVLAYSPNRNDQANTLTTPSSLVFNSADCIQIGVQPGKGPISGQMAMSVHRRYLEVDQKGNSLGDITDELRGSTQTYDDLVDGNKVGTVQGLDATYSDWSVKVVNGSQVEVIRGRFPENETDTQGYWLRRTEGTWTNVGETMEFTSPVVDGQITVRNNCGQAVSVDGFKIEKLRLLKDGATQAVTNAIQWIGRNCLFSDVMSQEHTLQAKGEPKEDKPIPKEEKPVPAPVQRPL